MFESNMQNLTKSITDNIKELTEEREMTKK